MNLASVSVSSEEDWAVISDEFESMTVGDRDEDGWDWCDRTTTPPTTTPSAVNNDRKEPGKESEEDFDLSSLQQPIPIPGGYIHVTYKDMLLKRRRDDDEDNPTVISSSMEVPPKSPWKARIVVQNALPWKRVDREYGIPPPVVYDDDDDDGTWLLLLLIVPTAFYLSTIIMVHGHWLSPIVISLLIIITSSSALTHTHHRFYNHVCFRFWT